MRRGTKDEAVRLPFLLKWKSIAPSLDFFYTLLLVSGESNFILSRTTQVLSMRKLTKKLSIAILLLGGCLIFSGCMKTRIVTDQAASTQQAEMPWAHGFVNGLVPPINAPLDTEPVCGGAGVSEVFFRQTFVQGIAQGLTSSLYSPQRFTATCAEGGTASVRTPPSYLLGDVTMPSATPGTASTESSTTK
jgi:hypothetical protein